MQRGERGRKKARKQKELRERYERGEFAPLAEQELKRESAEVGSSKPSASCQDSELGVGSVLSGSPEAPRADPPRPQVALLTAEETHTEALL